MSKALLTILGTISLVLVLGAVVWVAWRLLARTEDAGQLAVKWVATVVLATLLVYCASFGAFGLLGAIVLGLILGIIWAPHIGAVLAGPLASTFDGGSAEVERRPFYSMALGHRKQGRYQEAMAEVRKQLLVFPGDFEGLMLLAEIQIENLKEPVSAYETIEEILACPDLPQQHVAYALNRAADWHLKFDQDPAMARVALERIIQRCPETEQAHLARQRIAHLAPESFIKDRQEPHRIALKTFQDNIGLRDDVSGIAPVEEDPATLAQRYLDHLQAHPHDTEMREKLALLYADHYQRLDLASAELEQIIEIPNQPAKHVVRCLNLLAELEIRLAGDTEAARRTLKRIVDRFPKTAYAETALTRMAYLKLEARKSKTSQAVKLGSYEQNIGLKQRPPT